jgi:hypothetical protein
MSAKNVIAAKTPISPWDLSDTPVGRGAVMQNPLTTWKRQSGD